MGIRSLPGAARVYWAFVCLLGALSLSALQIFRVDFEGFQGIELGAFMVLAVLAGSKKVSLIRSKADVDVVSMSLGFVVMFAAMLRFGVVGALGTGILSSLSGCLYPRRQSLDRTVFTIALASVGTLAGSFVYIALNGWLLDADPIRTHTAVCGSAVVFFAMDTVGRAVMVALCSGQNPFKTWFHTYLWTAPSYFAGASISALAIVLLGRNTGWMFLFVAPVVFAMYKSSSLSTAHAEERLRHQERLTALCLAAVRSMAQSDRGQESLADLCARVLADVFDGATCVVELGDGSGAGVRVWSAAGPDADRFLSHAPDEAPPATFASTFRAPLFRDGLEAGALTLYDPTEGRFGEADVQFLSLMAEQLIAEQPFEAESGSQRAA